MGLVQRPINPKEKIVAIGSGKPKGFSKNPWECKKLGNNEMGQGHPKNEMSRGRLRNKMGGEAWDIV